MVERKKGKNLRLKEKSEFSQRALKKDKLGAVIFGCKHHTIAECLNKELFGLPAPHYAYVKNVTAGLTLYLFNYSDRTLHGIYEAVSCGKMNVNPLAWITSEGTELTPFPAQVRIREQRKCIPLLEAQFKPIIAKNYYLENHFWFELDKEQNRRLMKLFLSSPSPLPEKMLRLEKRSHPPKKANKNMFVVLSSSSVNDISDEESKNLDSEEFSEMAEMNLKENEHSSASVNNRDYLAPETKWTNLFKPSSFSVKNEEVLESQRVRLSSSISDSEVCRDAANTESDSCVVECWENIAFSDDDVKEIYETKVACLQYHDHESDRHDVPSSENKTSLDAEGELMLSVIDHVLAEEPGEVFIDTKEKVRSVLACIGSSERVHDQPNLTDRAFGKGSNAVSGGVLRGVLSSNFQNVITKLMQEVQGLKVSQLNQCLKIESLEHELALSKLEIDQLKKTCYRLECKASRALDNYNIEDPSISYFATEKSVFIVGGFNGHSWLPDLSLYSPYQDRAISLCSMNFIRAYAAMAELNSELYIFGGTLDGVWCDTVESYNPVSNQWVQRPSLKREKRSPAGASMHDQIFLIGGGNGSECFSDVELFNLNIGNWISTKSMLEKRFSPAATELNGALYVAGGYDGRHFLRSFERFDPRERAWTKLGGMHEKRGYHSLVAFKEKIYALGGYNGDTMLSSVEVFDPRIGSWMTREPMSVARAHFGSFVLGGKMYVIGGVQDDEVLDGMECYEGDSSGWQAIGTTALGKRSFCSALVL